MGYVGLKKRNGPVTGEREILRAFDFRTELISKRRTRFYLFLAFELISNGRIYIPSTEGSEISTQQPFTTFLFVEDLCPVEFAL